MAYLKSLCFEQLCSEVPDIANYYTKDEINNIVSGLGGITLEVVSELPATGDSSTIYLVENESDGYEQWVYSNDVWINIGSEDVDLSNYVTNEALNAALGSKQNTLTAGTNIQINGNTISATDTKYTAATANPLMDGTVAVGTSALYARQDHRHPTDTSRAPLASPAFTGTPTAPTNGTASTSNTQIATTAFVQNAINRRLPKSRTTFFSSTAAVSVPHATDTKWKLWTASAAGTMIATLYIRFVANATGIRFMAPYIAASGSSTYSGMGSGQQVSAASSGRTILSSSVVYHFTAGQSIWAGVYQGSGAALNVDERYLLGIWIPD